MTMIEKAKELGLMLAQSPEFIRMRTAEQAQNEDFEAQKLLEAYNTERTKIMQRAQRDDLTPEDMNVIRADMEAEYAKLQTNGIISEYIEAATAFNDLMKSVNTAISFYVSPEEPGGCGSGGCEGCSGCH